MKQIHHKAQNIFYYKLEQGYKRVGKDCIGSDCIAIESVHTPRSHTFIIILIVMIILNISSFKTRIHNNNSGTSSMYVFRSLVILLVVYIVCIIDPVESFGSSWSYDSIVTSMKHYGGRSRCSAISSANCGKDEDSIHEDGPLVCSMSISDSRVDMDDVRLTMNKNEKMRNRRQVLIQSTMSLLVMSSSCSSNSVANAACLSGDTSDECIGIYKLPLDDSVASYVDTPEHLAKMAPDLNWVPPVEYPKSIDDAITELKSLSERINSMDQLILKGDLKTAGKELLYIGPRVTVAGRVAIRKFSSSNSNSNSNNNSDNDNDSLSMKQYRAEVAHIDFLSGVGECDVMIGQAIRGELGAITLAQILILEIINDMKRDYSDLLKLLL